MREVLLIPATCAIVPNACVAEIAGAGHLLPLEQPQALADALLGWIERTPDA